MEEPFERIAVDIVGPLPRIRKGYQHVLAICDYATKYPEAFPLGSVEAHQIAEELIDFFFKIRVPHETLCDQGTNFLS